MFRILFLSFVAENTQIKKKTPHVYWTRFNRFQGYSVRFICFCCYTFFVVSQNCLKLNGRKFRLNLVRTGKTFKLKGKMLKFIHLICRANIPKRNKRLCCRFFVAFTSFIYIHVKDSCYKTDISQLLQLAAREFTSRRRFFPPFSCKN